ncbi:protein TIFY 8 isoform X2 [Andrographis paniculata]|uniref:protein TIFY 8 isoform X2 n=1 Tax=Andrographis paniculata TaxID=175694 RepID=UPI0021E80BBA|nr:protein TIFY 8 isoform X2 [Andrographis paniculata]
MAANAQSGSKIEKPIVGPNGGGDGEGKPAATFHDFLGNKGGGGGGQEPIPPPPEVSPSATSDLGSERLAGNHLEGIACYASRGDIAGRESSNRFARNKRSSSDSFIDKFQPGQLDSQDGAILTKLLRYSGAEQPRRLPDEEPSFVMNQMRPISISTRSDANPSKWDRTAAINPGHILQYPPRTGQVIPLGYQAAPNRIKESNVGPALVAQTAADEGSRTGIKGSGILSSINASGSGGAVAARQPAGVLIRSGKQKSGVGISEPESSAAAAFSHRGTESVGRQMTIFYGGQAHVFDNVHPNKM